MDYEYSTLEEKFNQLPEEVQHVLTSIQVADDIKSIADDNGLLLDQASTLFDLTSYVLLGLLPSKQFVVTLSKEAKIDQNIAQTIAGQINEKVFAKIRLSMRTVQERSEVGSMNNTSSIETVGGFTIEHENDTEADSTTNNTNLTSADKAKILAGVENPTGSPEISVQKHQEEIYTEPLVDHLLNAATATPMEKTLQAPIPANLPVETPAAAQQTIKPRPITPVSKLPPLNTDQKLKGPDMYREPIK